MKEAAFFDCIGITNHTILTSDVSKNCKLIKEDECLYRKSDSGLILARLWVNGKQTWRSTKTDNLTKARKWLEKWKGEQWALKNGIELTGVVLHHKRTTVNELIADYVESGHLTRTMQKKSACTIKNETGFLRPLRAYFGGMQAAGITLAECDKYFDWRKSGGYVAEFKLRGKSKVKRTRGGKRVVDMELGILSNVFSLAVRRGKLRANPLTSRGRYTSAADVRHCRDCAPTPEHLQRIADWLRAGEEHDVADLICFLAYSGLRIGEALPLDWEAVDWHKNLINVTREKRGVTPWVSIQPEMEKLLREMKARSRSYLLFPSPFNPETPRKSNPINRRIKAACVALGVRHVTPHGLRSYFVTQARQSGVGDGEIAKLIGDKSGAAIIASTYGDYRNDHLLEAARRIRLTAANSNADSNVMPAVSPEFSTTQQDSKQIEPVASKEDKRNVLKRPVTRRNPSSILCNQDVAGSSPAPGSTF